MEGCGGGKKVCKKRKKVAILRFRSGRSYLSSNEPGSVAVPF
jgi:hypothetical protein